MTAHKKVNYFFVNCIFMMMDAIIYDLLKIALHSTSLRSLTTDRHNQNRVTATYQKPDWSMSTINKQTYKKSQFGHSCLGLLGLGHVFVCTLTALKVILDDP